MTRPSTARRAVPPARRALLLLALLVALGVAAPAAPVSAHAFLESSSPADGAVLDRAPSQLQLQFSESVVLGATRIVVVDADGHHYGPKQLRLVAADESAGTESPAALVAVLPPLPRSAYRVSWETLSSDDLHRTSGVLVFGIEQPVTAGGLVEPVPRADEASLRWLLFVSLSLALGGALAARLFRRQGGEGPAASAERAERWSAWGALAGTALAAALLLDQLASSGWAGGQLLLSSYGQHWLLRETGFALLAVAALRGRRGGTSSRRDSILRCAGAVVVCIGSALLGHAGAGGNPAVTRVVADAAHLAAAGTWVGTLLILALFALPAMRAAGSRALSIRAALRSFGPPAAGCVCVMVVTGLYLASGVVGSVDAALVTVYGRTLLLKLLLAGVAGTLGLLNSRRLHRKPGRGLPVPTIAAEAAVGVSILALAAVLTSGQPALEPQLIARPAAATVPVVDGQAADLQETLAIRPNRPGRNLVLVGIFDTRRPTPATIRTVDVSFLGRDGTPSAPVSAERLADGRWSVPVELVTPGPTAVRVVARRAGLPAAAATYQWTVGAAPPNLRPETVSNSPIDAILKGASAALALVLGSLWGAWLLRRRRTRSPGADALDAQDAPDVPVDRERVTVR